MRQTVRIQKKIISYSYLFKAMGIIDEKEYTKITKRYTQKISNNIGK
ncbi:hypothetical protein ACFYKX_06095 [Cytobacillus sp. FJAT-54145]|uniref:Uncharacterized protein n=1 Tax=Cytobacillus spartinae TaxID=3299023 RepID=A0ABW6KBS6_9BACI